MKVADVSHPCKMWKVHYKWSELISDEFFLQGELEASLGLPISPLCDRSTHFLPKSQCNFVDYVVRPCVEVFADYCTSDASVWVGTMNDNYARWKDMYEEELRRKGEREEDKKAKKKSQVAPI